MVFLTRLLLKRDPNKSPFYKHQEIFRTVGHLIGRAHCEKKLAARRRDLDWKKQGRAIASGWTDRQNDQFVEMRLKGACDEHRISLTTFLESLSRLSIQLDKVGLEPYLISENVVDRPTDQPTDRSTDPLHHD